MKKALWKQGDLLLPILVFFSEYWSRHSQRQQESRLCRCCSRQLNCSDSENAVTFGAAKSQVGEGGGGVWPKRPVDVKQGTSEYVDDP